MHPITSDTEPHGTLPELPDTVAATCPADWGNGEVCGAPMAYAHNVREYHPVRSWSQDGLTLGECNVVDDPADEDPHLFCTAGHEWAVPEILEFE